jgi:hypothetical protein
MRKGNFLLMVVVVGIMLVSSTSLYAGGTPVFAEYVTGGTFDQTWLELYDEHGELVPANSDSDYPGLVFPNPSGDGWVMKMVPEVTYFGVSGGAAGEATWTDMLLSAQMFINIDTTYRHDSNIGVRQDLTSLYWGSACKGGFYSKDLWGGLSVPCWSIRTSGNNPGTPGSAPGYSSHGWHQIILVISGTDVSMYVDMTYSQVVEDLNSGSPSPLLTSTEGTETEGGICFYICYQDDGTTEGTGEPGYIDDIEVYLPPYELPPTPTATPTPGLYTEVSGSWTIYE